MSEIQPVKITTALKSATSAIVALTAVATLLIVMREPAASRLPGIALRRGAIVVSKPDTTLQDIAQALDDPDLFSYDEQRRVGRANLHLFVIEGGSLRIGSEEFSETLEFDTNVCGDASLRIGPDAAMYITNSEIATSHRSVSSNVCTRGYTIFSEGKLEAKNSKFMYISGNRSEFFRGNASGLLENVEIGLSDGSSLRMTNVDGQNVVIRNSRFETAAQYGVFLTGTTARPARIEDSIIIGQTADVFLSTGRSELVLVDCEFRKNRIMFENSTGSVTIKWSAQVKVEDNGQPVAGATVAAVAEGETVEGITDEQGMITLELTEQIVSSAGVRMVTPHTFSAGAGGEIIAQSGAVRIDGKSQDIGAIILNVNK